MYIPPFWCGVLTTLACQFVLNLVIVILSDARYRDDDDNNI